MNFGAHYFAVIWFGLIVTWGAFAQVIPNTPTPLDPSRADNSGTNARDRRSDEVTADQQGSADSDVEVTRQIRKHIIARKDLSLYAHNVKIISNHGRVTLKGPVKSQKEITTIQQIARKIAGANNVKSELQMASSK